MTQQPLSAEHFGRTVGEIAASLPGAAAVFRKFKIDFCCHGDVSLDEAAAGRGLDVATIADALRSLDASDLPEPAKLTSADLIDHIQTRYHETHRREIAELIQLSRKVEAVHKEHPQAPLGLADLLRQIEGELEVHMKKEELILFPAMHWADTALDMPIGQMRHDHNDHAEFLDRLKAVTEDFTLPEGACRSWQALYAGLAKFADDLVEHIHIENNILFPRFESR